jgi:hypothetical protein
VNDYPFLRLELTALWGGLILGEPEKGIEVVPGGSIAGLSHPCDQNSSLPSYCSLELARTVGCHLAGLFGYAKAQVLL